MPTDRYDQYTSDSAKFSPPPSFYEWQPPERPRGRGEGMPSARAGQGGVSVSVAGSEGAERLSPGEKFERDWRQSEDRADRLRRQWEGTRPWQGTPGDYEDVLGPNRSGGMDKVTAKLPPDGPDPLAPIPSIPTPPPSDLNGSAAKKVPSSNGSTAKKLPTPAGMGMNGHG